jgi:tetratricopeptide (TPR) repeat protein
LASPGEIGRKPKTERRPAKGPLSPAERHAYRVACRQFDGGDDEGALSRFNELLSHRAGLADVHYRVGVIHERKDDLEEAARSLWNALRINPAYAEAILALTSVYERQGDCERAAEIAERFRFASREVGPLDSTTRGKLANLQAQLGDALLEAGERREAIDCYRRALDRCPSFHDIRLRLGVALREAGLPDRSMAELRQVIQANPELPEARVQLGLTLNSLGRSDEAIREWNTVLESDPTRRDALMYLRMVSVPGS